MKQAAAGIVILGIANLLIPVDVETHLAAASNPWTDSLGRAIAPRVLIASVHSLWRGMVTGLLVSLVALVLASFRWDTRSSWLEYIASTLASVPLFVYLALTAALFHGAGWVVLSMATVLVGWPERFMQVRADAQRIGVLPYSLSARALGLPEHHIYWHRIVPNSHVAKSIFAASTAEYLVLFGALSVVGISAGEAVDLGKVIFEYLQRSPRLSVFPLAALTLLVLAIRSIERKLRQRQ